MHGLHNSLQLTTPSIRMALANHHHAPTGLASLSVLFVRIWTFILKIILWYIVVIHLGYLSLAFWSIYIFTSRNIPSLIHMKELKRGFPAKLHPVHQLWIYDCLFGEWNRALANGHGGDEWKVGWRVVFRGAALHQRKGNSLFGTLAGGYGVSSSLQTSGSR